MREAGLDHEADRWTQDRMIDSREPGTDLFGPALVIGLAAFGLFSLVMALAWWMLLGSVAR